MARQLLANQLVQPSTKDSKVLPGDLVVLSFDAEGLQATAVSRVRYALGVELSRKGAARPDYSRAGEDREAVLPFGGTRLPLHAVAKPKASAHRTNRSADLLKEKPSLLTSARCACAFGRRTSGSS